MFDALVLDVMMPGETGFDYARAVRQTSEVPILMLTARADPADRVNGLEIGADDYLPKPFEPRELILRLGNILKRAVPAARAAEPRRPRSIRFGPFTLPLRPGRAAPGRGGRPHHRARARDPHHPRHARAAGTSRARSWPAAASAPNERTVDVQINRLRRKIEVDPANPVFLQTVRGVGYRLVVDR